MTDYTPNSHKYKEEKRNASADEKRVQKAVTTTAKVKKNEMRKFADIFIAEDAKNIKSYILMDVLVPAIKKAISDIVTDGIDMLLFGGSGRGRKGSSRAGNVSYSKYYDDDRRYDDRRDSGSRYYRSYEDISVGSRQEADDVIRGMDELMESYGVVRVADFIDLHGLTCDSTDYKYGWTNVRSADIIRTRDGRYKVQMPRAIVINNRN